MKWGLFQKREIRINDRPYLDRHVLVQTPFGGVYVHRFRASDDDRSLHDHPWNFLSIILKGEYREIISEDGSYYRRRQGDIAYRKATHRHYVKLVTPEVWTLMIVGPRIRRWGFWVNADNNPSRFTVWGNEIKKIGSHIYEWCWWRKYNDKTGLCEDEILKTYGDD